MEAELFAEREAILTKETKFQSELKAKSIEHENVLSKEKRERETEQQEMLAKE
jgi:hypothetical protein